MLYAAHCEAEGLNDEPVHDCAMGKAQGGVEVMLRSNFPLTRSPPDVTPETMIACSVSH